MLNEELVEEFRQVLKTDYGLDLSSQETLLIATTLVDYYGILFRVAEQDLQKNQITGKIPL